MGAYISILFQPLARIIRQQFCYQVLHMSITNLERLTEQFNQFLVFVNSSQAKKKSSKHNLKEQQYQKEAVK